MALVKVALQLAPVHVQMLAKVALQLAPVLALEVVNIPVLMPIVKFF